MIETVHIPRPVCENCNSVNLRIRNDKTYQCRKCGYNNFPEYN